MTEQRKLAAILALDVVGFSRLASTDEERTLARLRALRSDVIDPAVSVHGGRVVKRTGDGALAEFRSVVSAVRCAIEIQGSMQERNAGVPEDRRIELRIGVHLGDVVEESDGDIMGDGVNIAARLEGIATPGSIYLSEDSYRQVRSRIDMEISSIGPVQLKNIPDAINVFALQVGSPKPETGTRPEAAEPSDSGQSSIAVLPFTNLNNDPAQDHLIDGIVEDIITELARYPDVSVVARNSTFIFKGKAVDVRQVAAELGVRYVLEGSARVAGNRIRITGQLIEAANGRHLWADRFDGSLDDVFALQDQVVAQVVGAVEPTLRSAEIERARQKPEDMLTAHEFYLRAQPRAVVLRSDENLIAIGYLDRALELDPHYGPALAYAAWCRVQRVRRATWSPAGEDDFGDAVSLAHRALKAGAGDAVTMAVAGFSLVTLKTDHLVGLDAVRHAVSLNPGSSFVSAMAGSAMVWCGDYEMGIENLNRCIAYGPKDPGYFLALNVAAAGELLRGRPEAALDAAQRAITLNPGSESGYWVLSAAFAQVGRMQEARAYLEKYLDLAPGTTISILRDTLPVHNAETLEVVLDSLAEAGLPA